MRTRSSLLVVPILALIAAGCDSTDLLSPDPVTFPLLGRVGVRATVFLYEDGVATVGVRLETEKIYTCLGYVIDTQVSRDRHAITIRLNSVRREGGACAAALGPASAGHTLTVPDGTYTLRLVYSDTTDSFDLRVRDRAFLRPKEDVTRTFLLPLPDIYVAADGSGDARTIREAMEMEPTQSSILLADGVYEGPDNTNLRVTSLLSIQSANGDPRSCIIRCDGTRAFTVANRGLLRLDGVAIENGRGERWMTRVQAGGAISCETGSLVASFCVFRGNQAWESGSPPRGPSGIGGAVFIQGGQAQLNSCTFVDNAGDDGSAVAVMEGMATLTRCTIVSNDSRSSALFVAGSSRLTVERTIVAFETGGRPVALANTENVIDLRCNDFVGNGGGDWVWPYDVIAGEDGNISGDPLFVDADAHDFRLLPGSPCAEAASSCGRMGAWPEL